MTTLVKLIERGDLREFGYSKESPPKADVHNLIRIISSGRDEYEWFEFGPGIAEITEYNGPFPLPYERCAFSYCGNDIYASVYFLEVVDQNKILVANFLRPLNEPNAHPRIASVFTLEHRNGQNSFDIHYTLTEWDDDAASYNVEEIGVLNALIHQPGLLKRVPVGAEATARKRARRGLPVPCKTVVDVAAYITRIEPWMEPTTQSEPTGAAKPPHMRRAHLRRLSSGRVVPVRASAIHGGPERSRDHYTVN